MRVVVIGAGAAGLTAAICAAKNGDKVTIIEHENKPGKKIAVTGNGKCNITNSKLSVENYYGDREFIRTVLNRFDCKDTIDFFEEMGVICYEKRGYYYPMSNQAVTVVNHLREYAYNLGVSIKTNNDVKDIRCQGDNFVLDIGIEIPCDKLIIATGGMAAPKTGSDGSGYEFAGKFGHSIVEPKPALTGLVCADSPLKKASGVRVKAKVSIYDSKAADIGEVQITDYGISGIPVFNISRMAEYGTKIIIDFLPEYTYQDVYERIKTLCKIDEKGFISTALNGLFHEKLVTAFLKAAKIEPATKCIDITEKQIALFCDLIKAFSMIVSKRKGVDYAQVTQGGVSTNEINPNTMESLLQKNLFFAGEIIDVDGRCGGYNLQFAWSTGMIAGGHFKE